MLLLFLVNLFIKTILTLLYKFTYMQIFLKNPFNKTHTLEMDETDTIRTLFVVINNIVNVPYNFFYLTYGGKVIGPESYSYTLLHFVGGYDFNDNFRLQAGVNNATDLEYIATRHPSGARAGAPLTAYVKGVAKF